MITDRGRLLSNAMTSIKVSNTLILSRRSTSQGHGLLRDK